MSSNAPVIVANAVSKTYRMYRSPLHQLAGALGAKSLGQDLTALQPLSFELSRGESVAIVGRNGSGKSTLLSLIAGTSSPSTGFVQTYGRVVALLELGSGFDPEFSGRDNVYLNGHILGLTQKEIDSRFDAIAAFADIGASLDRPVKTYSSGMQMRLAFSVAAHTDPDVLIIDESLSVGDAAFVQKCMRFLRSYRERGTLLFVSHDMSAVKTLCDRALWLEKGELKADGDAKQIGDAYLAWIYGAQHVTKSITDSDKILHESRTQNHTPTPGAVQMQGFEFNPNSDQFGDGAAELVAIEMIGSDGKALSHISASDTVTLSISARANQTIQSPIIGFIVRDRLGQPLFGSNTCVSGKERPALQSGQLLEVHFCFTMPRLASGSYSISAAISGGTQSEHTPHDWRHEMMVFDVTASPFNHGLMDILMQEVHVIYKEDNRDDAA